MRVPYGFVGLGFFWGFFFAPALEFLSILFGYFKPVLFFLENVQHGPVPNFSIFHSNC